MVGIKLNTEQLSAVDHLSGPLLVLAGAGSGKTRVITSRIAKLIETGVDPKQILAVTFTNKAATEMRERIEAAVTSAPLICTFHSLGVRILRESIHYLGYNNNFVIYDEEDALKVLRQCIKELNIEDKKITPKALKHIISKAKNCLKEPTDEDATSPIEQIAPQVYRLYHKKLLEASAVDFDDLLVLPVKLFQQEPQVLEKYQDRWIHLLVDEYQDTNKAQYVLASLLVSKNKNFFVVGDPDQSIYTWRGANIKNILNFEKDWPTAKIIRLEQNYRSTSNILAAANGLISCNESRYKKNLWSDLGEGEKVHEYSAYNDREEADFIVQTLLNIQNKHDIPLKEIVIFYRTNAQSRPFEDELLKHNIPYVVLGGISFYQRREVKDLLAYLRVIANPADLVSFLRTINLPKRGLGEATLNKISQFANAEGLPILEACRKLTTEPALVKLSQKQLSGLGEYLKLINELKQVSIESSLHELVYQTTQKSGYLDVIKLDGETYEDRKANIDELIAKSIEWESTTDQPTLAKFLEDLTLNTQAETNIEGKDRLTLMSLHNGKGLEFHTVFMAGMEETLFPHINALNESRGIEEERRLCYVGMTRAKRILYLTQATTRFIWGGVRSMRPSRFLKEIPRQYLSKNVSISEELSLSEKMSHGMRTSNFSNGDLVFHNDFGVGKIIKTRESSLGLTYEITFQKDGSTKTLLAKYAKLNPLN